MWWLSCNDNTCTSGRCTSLNTPDDGRLRPKHVEWLCRNKTCTVLHQVGVSFDLYYDARKHKIKNVTKCIWKQGVEGNTWSQEGEGNRWRRICVMRIFVPRSPPECCSEQIKEDQVDGICQKQERDEKCVHKFGREVWMAGRCERRGKQLFYRRHLNRRFDKHCVISSLCDALSTEIFRQKEEFSKLNLEAVGFANR